MTPRVFACDVFIALACCLTLSQNAIAQDQYYLKTYTTENGLPHNNIRDIAQDKTGFLWVATWDGLSRFDGYDFKNYFHNPSDSTSIPFFSVLKVVVDGGNNVWVLCEHNQVAKYDRAADRFISFDRAISNHCPSVNHIDIEKDPDENLWISTEKGLIKVSWQTITAREILVENKNGVSLFRDHSYSIFFDDKGDIWLHSPDQFVRCRQIDTTLYGELKSYSLGKLQKLLSSYANLNLDCEISRFSGEPIIFSNQGLYRTDSLTSVISEYSYKPIIKENVTNRPFVWGNSNGSIYTCSSGLPECGSVQLLRNHAATCFFRDNENSIWYGEASRNGSGAGLTRCQEVGTGFKYPLFNPGKNQNDLAVSAIIKDHDGNIWVGTRDKGELWRISPDGARKYWPYPSGLPVRNTAFVKAFVEDLDGIWIGYNNGTLAFYSFISQKIRVLLNPDAPGSAANQPREIHSLFMEEHGTLLISGSGIISRLDPVSGNITLLSDHIVPMNAYCLVKDSNNRYWLGSGNSTLYSFDSTFRQVKSYKLCKANYNIEDIRFTNGNTMWIATLGGGICYFDPLTNSSEFFTTSNGLSNNTTYSIRLDKEGNLWISTDHGISMFNPDTRQFRVYGPTDGLKINEFNADASFMSADGRIFMGGMGGLAAFFPESLHDNFRDEENTRLVISEVRVSGIPRHFSKAVYETKEIRLSRGDDNLQVSFACLSFKMADRIKYRHRLCGYDKNWIETDYRNRMVTYARLTPGHYSLELEATNLDGNWVHKAGLDIYIPAIYYQSQWFKAAILALALIISVVFVYMYNRQIRLKEQQKQEQLRLESLRGQMNPHFIFNSLNSINYFISQNDRLSANRYIADFSRLIRSILNNLSAEYVPLENELESLKEYLSLEYLRFSDKFDYTIEVSPDINAEFIEVFPGLAQPFVENAIWHGIRGLENRKGFIKIRFFKADISKLNCIIEDDGIGRKLASENRNSMPGRRSRGMGIVQERLRIINRLHRANYTVQIEDIKPGIRETGTRVVIEIPAREITPG